MPGQIKYNGKVLATMKDGTTVELNTTKKELQGNIEIAVESGGITPTGTLDITANGSYDVTEKAQVNVAVPTPVLVEGEATPTEADQEFTPTEADGYSKFTVKKIPSGYIKPSGTLTVTANGTFDVTEKASVTVAIPVYDGTVVIS